MASNSDGTVKLLRCPDCHAVLPEYSHITVYRCGGCHAVLRAKNRNDNGEGSRLNWEKTESSFSDSSETYFSEDGPSFSTESNRTLEDMFTVTRLTDTPMMETTFLLSQNPPRDTSEISSPKNISVFSNKDEFTVSPWTEDPSPMENIFVHPRNAAKQTQNVETDELLRCRNTIFGGAPFIICSSCFTLLRVKSMIRTSKQRLMLRCGECFEVLLYNFLRRTTAVDSDNSNTKASLKKIFGTKDHEVDQGVSPELMEGDVPSLITKSKNLDLNESLEKIEKLRDQPIEVGKQEGCSTSGSGSSVPLHLTRLPFESQRFWDEIVGLLINNGAKGSALLVTTTSTTLIDAIGADHSYYLSKLSNEYCWFLFESRAFYGYNPHDHPNLVKIGKKLVRSCKENPLCIKMLADLLHLSVTEKWWSAISERRLWSINESEGYLMPALRVCYNRLPKHLKRCFRYCSLFPKNYVFSKHHLVGLWLSEGFIEPVRGKELEKIGIEYFDDLIKRSFFEHLHICESEDDKYVMHSVIHELAEKYSSNKYFRSEGCLQKAPENTCHLSVFPYEFQTISLANLTTETKDLQTMLFMGGSRFVPEDTFTPVVSIVGLNDLFMKFRGLITLDLSSTDVEELPNSIAFLTCLKYLGLNNTDIKNIPTCISKLIALQTLQAKNCYYLTELPETLKELAALRHLDVTNESGYVATPHGIGQLTNLVSLAAFAVGSDPAHSKIEELNGLENLQGSLQISGIENITCGEDAKGANFQGKPNLQTLSLQWGNAATYPEDEEEEEEKDADIAEKILENLRPNNNLQELIIRNYGGKQFPIWFEDPALFRLVSIVLDNCYSCTMLPTLGRLPSLRYLSINRMHGVCRMIDDSSVGEENISMYPSLELLSLSEMYGLEELPERNNQDFPLLQTLSINKCPFLRRIPHLPTLLELSIFYGDQLPEIPDLPSLESMKIEGFQKIKSIYMSCTLPALKKLEIRYCKELSSVACQSQIAFTTKFKIVGCQKLKVANYASLLSEKR